MTRRRRWLLTIGLILFGLTLCPGGPAALLTIDRWHAQQELDDAIAFVDATEPRWRLAEVEADRRVVPPEQNAAVVVREARALLPPKWTGGSTDLLDQVPPPVELTPAQAETIATELAAGAAALAKAVTLQELPRGRHRLEYARDFISTLVPDQQNVRDVARLLALDAAHAAHVKDETRAWQANRALLNAGRSFGDEPLLISMLVRIAVSTITVRSLERSLGQGEWTAAHLEERQRALADELAVPYFLIGIRGERAGSDRLLTNLETGQLALSAVLDNTGRGRGIPEATAWDRLVGSLTEPMVRRSHALLLRYYTGLAEAARTPPPRRYDEVTRLANAFRDEARAGDRRAMLAHLLATAVDKIAYAEQRSHSQLACAVAGLAAERYRLAHGRWPASLPELVAAGLLAEVPVDRVDGQPLRYRATPDGIVIYSIGQDRVYAGTGLDDFEAFDPNALRTEFRLWDPPHRRQHWQPPAGPAEGP